MTGLDVSEVALGRARAAAADAGVDVTWLLADLADDPTGGTTFDLVSAQYPVLRQSEGDVEVRALLGAVAPGGTLLLAFHAGVDEEHTRAHGFDPADFLWPPDLVDATSTRAPGPSRSRRPALASRDRGHDSPHVDDHVIRARRLA